MSPFTYLPTFIAVLLIGVAGDLVSAQEIEFGGQDLTVGESDFETSPSVADDLERDLSAGDDEYDTPLSPDPPATPWERPSNDQAYFDNGQTYVPAGEVNVDSTPRSEINRSDMIRAGVLAAIGALGYFFLWFFAEVTT